MTTKMLSAILVGVLLLVVAFVVQGRTPPQQDIRNQNAELADLKRELG